MEDAQWCSRKTKVWNRLDIQKNDDYVPGGKIWHFMGSKKCLHPKERVHTIQICTDSQIALSALDTIKPISVELSPVASKTKSSLAWQ